MQNKIYKYPTIRVGAKGCHFMRTLKSFSIILLLSLVISGCGFGNNARNNNTNSESLTRVKNTTNEDNEQQANQDISRNLVNLATRVPNVNDATAVVVGKYAIVGIDVNSNIDQSRVGTIKYSVAESLQNDPHGANAIIIADPDLNRRLERIANEVNNGRPVQGFMNELAAIVGRVMPEVPSDIFPARNPDPTQQNNSELNKNEENQLNERQNKQSNQHLQK